MSSEENALEKLIAIEWEIVHGLQRKLACEDSVANVVKISNSIAYHVNNLNKLLARKGEKADDAGDSLAKVLVQLPKKFNQIFRRRGKRWKPKKPA